MRVFLICMFLALAGPALADTTAVYETPAGNFRMTIEIADNGDVRGDIAGQPGVYFLTRGGQGYFVLETANGVVVDRVEDTVEAVKRVAEKRLNPAFKALMEAAADPELAKMGPMLTKGDDIVVQGRKGTPYYFPGPRGPDVPPVIVVSSDPELAPLGVAIAGQFAMSDRLQLVPNANPIAAEFQSIMRGGAPISIVGAELKTVSHQPVAPSRFELPAAPESLEDIVKRIEATATDQRVSAF